MPNFTQDLSYIVQQRAKRPLLLSLEYPRAPSKIHIWGQALISREKVKYSVMSSQNIRHSAVHCRSKNSKVSKRYQVRELSRSPSRHARAPERNRDSDPARHPPEDHAENGSGDFLNSLQSQASPIAAGLSLASPVTGINHG